MARLKDRVVWITGSGRGIGRAAALAFAEAGSWVVVSARTAAEVRAVAEEIEKSGGSALGIPCDVTDERQIENLVSKVGRHWGDIEILINNAGVGVFKKVVDLAPDEWDTMMEINLKGAYLCARAVLPAMIERQAGHIVNVVSVAGQQPYYNCGGYCASKYGLLGFTDVLRLEVRKHGIRVSAFLPGATDTAIWGDADVDRSRMMKPEGVATALRHICELEGDAVAEQVILRPPGGDL